MPLFERQTSEPPQDRLGMYEGIPEDQPRPSALDVAAASLRQSSLIGGLYEKTTQGGFQSFPAQQNYDPLDDITGYEPFAQRFLDSSSPEQTAYLKRMIDSDLADRKTLNDAGGWGLASSLAAGISDPTNLLLAFIPLGAPTRLAGLARGAVSGVLGEIPIQAAQESLHPTQTREESVFRVGTAAILNGLLGAAISRRIPLGEFNKTAETLAKDIETPFAGSTVGASSASAATTLEDEGIARGGEWLAKTLGRVSPLARLITSPVKSVRELTQKLIDVPFALGKNLRGIATESSAELRSRAYDAMVVKDVLERDRIYQGYRTRVKSEGGEPLSRGEFSEQVSYAMRRGDEHSIPEVSQAAKAVRSKIIEPMTKEAQALGQLPDPVQIAQKKLEDKAIERYVSAQEAQIYADYAANFNAKARVAIAEAAATVREQRAIAMQNILAERERSIHVESDVRNQSVNKAIEAAEQAKKEFSQARAQLRMVAGGKEYRLKLFELKATRDKALGASRLAKERAARVESANIAKLKADSSAQISKTNESFREKIAAAREGTGKLLSKNEFRKATGKQAISDPHVQMLADLLERQKIGDLAHVVTVPKTKVTGFDVIGARSYLPRLYRVPKIKANQSDWRARLEEAFVKQGAERAEAKTAVDEVTNKILGTTRGYVSLEPNITVKSGPLKERVLNVPDEVLEPYLENNIDKVMHQYVRSVAPQIEVSRALGASKTEGGLTELFESEIKKITDEYAVLKERAVGNDKAIAKLTEREKADVQDLNAMRDRVLGKFGMPADPDSMIVKAGHFLRTWSYLSKLGSQTIGSAADVGRVISRYGLTHTAEGLAKLAMNFSKWNLARADAKRLGAGLDWTLNTRGRSLGEIGDYADTRLQEYEQKFSNQFTRVTGMATWNSTLKFLTVALEQDSILNAALKSTNNKNTITKLAEMGVGEDLLPRIAKQFERYGETDGLKRARTDLWDDRQAAHAVEQALLKASDIIVMTKGHGDTPLLMSNELVKTLLQFKGFGIASVNRLLIPAAQGMARGDIAMMNGLLSMLALGVLRYVAKQYFADQPIELTPGRVLAEAVDGSGLNAYLSDPYDIVADVAGIPRASRYSDRSWIETLAGPSIGTAVDALKTVEDLRRDGVSQRDVHKIRRLLPYQNLFYARRAINWLEDSATEALGIPKR